MTYKIGNDYHSTNTVKTHVIATVTSEDKLQKPNNNKTPTTANWLKTNLNSTIRLTKAILQRHLTNEVT